MTESWRLILISGCLALAFALANVYNGPGSSLPILTYASGLLLISVCMVIFGDSISFRDRVAPLLIAYVLWLGVSISWSVLAENSFYYFWLFASMPFVYFVVRQLPEDHWLKLLRLLLVPVCLSAVWGIGEFVVSRQRSNGPLLDPNAWAALHNLFFFVVLSVYLSDDRKSALKTRSTEAVLLLIVIAFFAAYSRVATVIWLVSLCFILSISFLGRLDRRKILTVVIIAAVGYTLVHGYVRQSDASLNAGYTVNFEAQGWSQRFAIWKASWEIYQESHWLGTGLATFNVQYPSHRTTGDLTNHGNFVHNDYLQFLQEGGPVHLLFLLSLIGYLLLLLYQATARYLTEKKAGSSLQMLVLVVALGTPFVHSLMNFTLYLLTVQMMVGVLLARVLALREEWIPAVNGKPLPVRMALPGLVILFIAWGVLVLDAISFGLIYQHKGIPGITWVRKDPGRYFDLVYWLTHISPGNSSNHIALATLYRQTMDQQTDTAAIESLSVAAASEYRQGLEINPFRYAVQIHYADLLESNPEIYKAFPGEHSPIDIMERTLVTSPIYLHLYLRLARFYQEEGEDNKAYRLLKEKAFTWIDMHYINFELYQDEFVRVLGDMASDRRDQPVLDRLASWSAQHRN
jgi:O-antigen ligase